VVRLFQKGAGQMTPNAVHEAVEITGVVKALDVSIEYFMANNLSKALVKIDHYPTAGVQEAFNKDRKATVWSALFRAILAFFQNYFLKLGILDGSRGLTLSVLDLINKFFKYAELSELHKQARSAGQNL